MRKIISPAAVDAALDSLRRSFRSVTSHRFHQADELSHRKALMMGRIPISVNVRLVWQMRGSRREGFEMANVAKIRQMFRCLRRENRGASLIEFALVAPVLMLMLGGLFSASSYLRARMTIHSYAREAARGVSVGYMTVADARSFAEGRANRDLHVAVSATIDPATKGDPNDRDVEVTLRISQAEMARLTPFVGIISGGVSSSVVMRSMVE